MKNISTKPRRLNAEQMKHFREQMQARFGKTFTKEEIENIIHNMRDDEVVDLSEFLQRKIVVQPSVDRTDLIKKMREFREQIRDRVGDIDTTADLERLRQERDDELMGLC